MKYILSNLIMILLLMSCQSKNNKIQKTEYIPLFNGDQTEITTTNDSINYFIDSTFAIIQKHYIYKDEIQWDKVNSKAYTNALNKDNLKDVFPFFTALFNEIEDNHSMFWNGDKKYSASKVFEKIPSPQKSIIDAYNEGKSFLMAKRIQDYGYIRIPYLKTSDDFEKEILKPQEIQDMICEIYSNDIKGWIIDLRLNGGGDMYPMISGLQQFLGEGIFASVKQRENIFHWSIKDGAVLYNNEKAAILKNYCLPKELVEAKVAVLISQFTASSGEVTGLAFKKRANTIFIGERTRGMMTANEIYDLPFGEGIEPLGNILTLSIGTELDRNGEVHSHLKPDIESIKGDNFDELEKDLKVIKAIKWFNKNESL